jgi:hypothetical protein
VRTKRVKNSASRGFHLRSAGEVVEMVTTAAMSPPYRVGKEKAHYI